MKRSSCAERAVEQHLQSEIVFQIMAEANLVLVAGETVRRLKSAAESSLGATALREAGYAGGSALYTYKIRNRNRRY